MMLFSLFHRLPRYLGGSRRRVSPEPLTRLNAHLLRDIGLHVEGGVVRPLNPSIVPAPRRTDAAAPLTGRPPVAARRSGAEVCPHCGMALT
ncbi:hypothetical protein FZZ93_08070 [Halomonas eurihalina]|uniref:DUF1127 domain-containing protein n=1 Tax=Halomonas eurihalina TaxID=42566 RepID=A0A5D9D8V6_HALER|nr:hypothetical protein [Halomonas eurihalina]MDR5860581.1 hypothetical protein [Halomonas eurihalina]TZG40187.1 hypothetical protein FZZ93_08070 [Halomonas eurihalina]